MTVTATNTYSELVGNGSATAFPFTFAAASAAEVDVYLDGALQGGGYTVTLNASGTGGTVLFDIAPPTGVAVLLASAPGFRQDSSFENNAAFRPDVFNRIHDRLSVYSLWLRDRVRLLFPAGPLLPDARAGKYLAFDAAGDPVFTDGTGVDAALRTDLAAPAGTALLSHTQSGSGAVARTLQSVLRDTVNVLDFGADPTGATESTAAFNNAIATGKDVRVPPGTFRINITVPHGTRIIGSGREKTYIENWGDAPVFTISNATDNIRGVHLEGMYLRNRNKAVYTSADGIYINGNDGLKENDYLTFVDLTCFQFRYGVRIEGRSIWNRWIRCGFIEAILDGFWSDCQDNQTLQSFETCRFAANGRYGLHIEQNFSAILATSWTFLNCNWENNLSVPVRITGPVGIQSWSFIGCYSEENTTIVAPGSTSPRKAGFMFLDCPYAFGLTFDACVFNENAAPAVDPDYYIYIDDACTFVNGKIENCRGGNAVIASVKWKRNLTVGRNENMSFDIDRNDGCIVLTELVAETSATPTLTLTGCTTSPTGVARLVRNGKQVTAYIPTITGTSNATTATLTGVPAEFRPATVQTVLCITQDGSGGIAVGSATVQTDGTISLFKDAGGGAFANTGTKGVRLQTLVWSLA